jgi:hypothetical protein
MSTDRCHFGHAGRGHDGSVNDGICLLCKFSVHHTPPPSWVPERKIQTATTAIVASSTNTTTIPHPSSTSLLTAALAQQSSSGSRAVVRISDSGDRMLAEWNGPDWWSCCRVCSFSLPSNPSSFMFAAYPFQ